MRKKQMPARAAVVIACFALAVGLSGCAGARRGEGGGLWRETGLASWYGADFHGRRTANGERYNMYAMTAAHKTLPLGTRITVTRRDNGRRVNVRVNDRGPFVAGRVVDLSYAAARKLGSSSEGVVAVVLEARLPASAFAAPPSTMAPARPTAPTAAPPPPSLRGVFSVQVGAFAVEGNARRLCEVMLLSYEQAHVARTDDNRGTWWRVRAGRFETEDEARRAAAALQERGYAAFVVRED